VAKHRREDDRRRDLFVAWHIEAAARQKVLPPLMQWVSPAKPRQSQAELAAMLHMMSARYNLPIQPLHTKAVHA
jgi:hypothetical protein